MTNWITTVYIVHNIHLFPFLMTNTAASTTNTHHIKWYYVCCGTTALIRHTKAFQQVPKAYRMFITCLEHHAHTCAVLKIIILWVWLPMATHIFFPLNTCSNDELNNSLPSAYIVTLFICFLFLMICTVPSRIDTCHLLNDVLFALELQHCINNAYQAHHSHVHCT